MRLRRATLAALAAALAAPAQAAAGSAFCAELRRIVAAAGATPAFGSLPDEPDREWLGGLGRCRRVTQGGDGFHCRLWTRGVPDGRPGLAARVEACLPGAALEIDDPDSRDHWDRRLTRLRAGGTVIDVEEHGGPGVHVGWYYSIEVHAAGE